MQLLPEAAPFEAVNAATGCPLSLTMQVLWLTGRILPVGAELRVRHLFRSGEPSPSSSSTPLPCPATVPCTASECGARDFQ